MTYPGDLTTMEPFADEGCLNVIVETPKGSRNKYTYDHTQQIFKLKKMLPAGAVFPFDFGFVPGTLAEDGDPLDILVLMDEPAFPGCLLRVRLVGAIEARQTSRHKVTRNDRLIAVAEEVSIHCKVKSLVELGSGIVEQIEHFFISYNKYEGKSFKPLRRAGPRQARQLVEAAHRRFLSAGRKSS